MCEKKKYKKEIQFKYQPENEIINIIVEKPDQISKKQTKKLKKIGQIRKEIIALKSINKLSYYS